MIAIDECPESTDTSTGMVTGMGTGTGTDNGTDNGSGSGTTQQQQQQKEHQQQERQEENNVTLRQSLPPSLLPQPPLPPSPPPSLPPQDYYEYEYAERAMNMTLFDPPRWGWTAVGGVADLLSPHEVRVQKLYYNEDVCVDVDVDVILFYSKYIFCLSPKKSRIFNIETAFPFPNVLVLVLFNFKFFYLPLSFCLFAAITET
jgi:hypothetical protein